MKQKTDSLRERLIADLPASLVVFLVALPLSLGIALASGAPIRAGIISAICGGIVVGLLGGAPFQVSGAAAGLTVLVFGFIQKFGFEATCFITILAGLLQVILGVARVARMTLIISPAVIHAMLAGIGILITLGQLHVLMGKNPYGSGPENILKLSETISQINFSALGLGLLTLFVLFAWKEIPKKFPVKIFSLIPGSLIAVGLSTLLAVLFKLDVPRVTFDSGLFNGFALPQFPSVPLSDIVTGVLAITLVASAESLLCAVATDKLHSGPRAQLNRELFAQGMGNITSGLLLGLPITGVIVRSAANITAGAKSRYSAVLHGVWVLLFSSLFVDGMRQVPLAALAGLLIFVGVSLVKMDHVRHLAHYKEHFVYFATLFGVVFINLLAGIGIGFGLSLFVLLYRVSKVEASVKTEGNHVHVDVAGSLTFLSIPQLSAVLNDIPPEKTVHLNFKADRLDFSAIDALRAWVAGYERTGGKVVKESLDTLWKALNKSSGRSRRAKLATK